MYTNHTVVTKAEHKFSAMLFASMCPESICTGESFITRLAHEGTDSGHIGMYWAAIPVDWKKDHHSFLFLAGLLLKRRERGLVRMLAMSTSQLTRYVFNMYETKKRKEKKLKVTRESEGILLQGWHKGTFSNRDKDQQFLRPTQLHDWYESDGTQLLLVRSAWCCLKILFD